MDLLKFSEEESEKINLNIYRSFQINRFNHLDLLNEISLKQPDVIRLKVPFEDANIFEQIDKIALPYNIFKSLIRMSMSKDAKASTYKINESIQFEPYTFSNEKILRLLLKNSLEEPTEIGFTNDIYNDIIDKQKMVELSTEYYISLANQGESKSNYFYLAYFENECIGFCSFQIRDKKSEGLFYTILPKYRSKGFARDLLEYAKLNSFKLGADDFSTNTIIQNPRSIYPQMKIGLVPQESYMNVIFFPLLSLKPIHHKEITAIDFSDLTTKVYEWINEKGYSALHFENIKIYHESGEFPSDILLKLFVFNEHTVILSAVNMQAQFWAYFTGKLN